MITFNVEDFKKISTDVFNAESPTGYTYDGVKVVCNYLRELGYEYEIRNKGTIALKIEGLDHSKVVATSAHLDTLGLMVRSINSDGTLRVVKLGGPVSPSLDSEYCHIITRDGKKYEGTIQSVVPAKHVFPDADTKSREIDNLIVKIDEIVNNANDVKNLGIDNGDIVLIDPKFTITDSLFLKSRFIDDKASVVVILMLLKYMKENGLKFKYDTRIYFSVYEEVGHGASATDTDITEFVTIDMGCIGLDLAGSEYKVSICAKDASGPYDYELTTRLINMAKENNIDYVVDIFPMYSSDVSAALRGGCDFKGALIGTGVYASHGLERTHAKGIENTLKLIYAYLVG